MEILGSLIYILINSTLYTLYIVRIYLIYKWLQIKIDKRVEDVYINVEDVYFNPINRVEDVYFNSRRCLL